MPDDELPVTTKTPGSTTDDSMDTHPAFGLISAARVSSNPGAYLYGSDFRHGHYINVRIHRSTLHRGLSRDWPAQGDELIEVALSEAQWATFVSTLNFSTGAQCTLERIGGQPVPGIMAVPDRRAQFRGELKDRLQAATDAIKALALLIDGSNLSKAVKEQCRHEIITAQNNLWSNIGFVAKSFDEHLDTQTGRAKVEIEAWLAAVVAKAGLDVLKLAGAGPFELPAGPETDSPALPDRVESSTKGNNP